ncbi:MAG: hypothetical protein LBD22_06775 [Spirochaetaceae bacterium]|jgi:epoxyqueuosine reductase|nr:hypothetical protein [Spirochaetaceae bacterium]
MSVKANKEYILQSALTAGFVRSRILSPFPAEKAGLNQHISYSLLMTALPYAVTEIPAPPPGFAEIARFARAHYYREAVLRLKNIARLIRTAFGGEKSDYRIFCNSICLDERESAVLCGLGARGKHGLIITPEAGSWVILASMTLPFELAADPPLSSLPYPFCTSCPAESPPCAVSCPTGAVCANGKITVKMCIQWYASGHGINPPAAVCNNWGQRLYGCDECQRYCPHNQHHVPGVETALGIVPCLIPAGEILSASDDELKRRFKGTALGFSWLTPAVLRASAQIVRGY